MTDQAQRQQAADPAISCILSAPAGSGKTTQLIRRYLGLLQTVDKPEEVLCITFTIKAAAEMRQRIMAALRQAGNSGQGRGGQGRADDSEVALAKEVLLRDRQKQWGLLRSPQRLNVLTLDALCARLIKASPTAHLARAQTGALIAPNYRIETDATHCYLEAARALIRESSLDETEHLGRQRLLRRFSGNVARLEESLANLLSARHEWLPFLISAGSMEAIEDNWRQLVEDWSQLLSKEAKALQLPVVPPKDAAARRQWWVERRDLWLTQAGTVRKKDGTEEDKAVYERLWVLLAEPKRQESAEHFRVLLLSFVDFLKIADGGFAWHDEVRAFLLRSVAQLTVDMVEAGIADYTAVALAADVALGNENHITELALAMDYRLRHILVDEMQDLSPHQLQLLGKLIAGWQKDDGRTLLLVGDTNQSCYNFRGARPGLIARLASQGRLEQLELEPLGLQRNFRSQGELINFFNHLFVGVFPERSDFNRGADPYRKMDAAGKASALPAEIETHLWQVSKDKKGRTRYKKGRTRDKKGRTGDFRKSSRLAMAKQGVDFVRRTLEEFEQVPDNTDADGLPTDETTIAVLVHHRSELGAVVEQLRQARIDFSADATVLYRSSEMVRTLLALARALRNPADRIAWLALLRSPLCGLSFADLHVLGSDKPELYGCKTEALWAAMHRDKRLEALSADGRQRVERLAQVLRQLWRASQHQTPIQQLHRAWHQLRAAEIYCDEEELAHNVFAEIESWQGLDDWTEAETRLLDRTYLPGKPGKRVRLMTIHAAKGLQFGAVLLPDMVATGRSGERPLLAADHWYHGEKSYALADLRDFSDDRSGAFFSQLTRDRQANEKVRLCYVAMTRAIHRLCLCGAWNSERPRAGSLLASIYDSQYLGGYIRQLSAQEYLEKLKELGVEVEAKTDSDVAVADSIRTRFADWQLEPEEEEEGKESFRLPAPPHLPGVRLRAQGTLVHLLLESVVDKGLEHWRQRLAQQDGQLRMLCQTQLRMAGVSCDQLDEAVGEVLQCLNAAVEDEQHAWLFGAPADALSGGEVALGLKSEGQYLLRQMRMDLSVLDDEGSRWIVDYKVARRRDGESQDAFCQRQLEMYAEQLARYRAAVAEMEPSRRLRCALYFPREQMLLEALSLDAGADAAEGKNWVIL